MASLFKVTTTPLPTDPILGDTNFQDHFPAVNTSMLWATLEPFVRQAERRSLFPYICKDFYDELVTIEAGSPSAEQLELIELVRDALAHYTMHSAIAKLNGVISDQGVQESSSNDGTSQPIAMWRYKNMRWEIINHADDFLDTLLERMEQLAAAGDASVATWVTSPCFTLNSSCLFRSTSQLRACIHMRNSRRTFAALLPFIRKAEDQFVLSLLCEDQYDDLCVMVENVDTPLAAEDQALLDKCRPVAAHYGLLQAIPRLRIVVEPDGLKSVSSDDGMSAKQAADGPAIAELQATVDADARTAVAELREFLYENADDYPLWKASDCYVDPNSAEACPTDPDHHTGAILL